MEDFAQYLATTGESIIDPLIVIWYNFMQILPGLFSAILIMIVGYFFGMLIESIAVRAMKKIGLDELMAKHHLTDSIRNYSLATVVGKVAFWYIIIIFLHSALQQVQIDGLSGFFEKLTAWLPSLFAGAAIFVGGLILAQIVFNAILDTVKSRRKAKVEPMARIVKGLIVFFFTLTAAGQVGIRVFLIEQTWLILVGAAAFALALGAGLALGHALKDPMKQGVKKLLK